MLTNLGVAPQIKGRKDLGSRKLILVDDGMNPYRTMCFTIAAKIVKKRGGTIETVQARPGETPHAKVVTISQPPKTRPAARSSRQ